MNKELVDAGIPVVSIQALLSLYHLNTIHILFIRS